MSAFKVAKSGVSTRVAAKELTRGRAEHVVATFLAGELSALRTYEADLLCAETQLPTLHMGPGDVRVSSHLPLVPQELAVLMLSAAAVSVHKTHAAVTSKY
jgi:hypothetical protein